MSNHDQLQSLITSEKLSKIQKEYFSELMDVFSTPNKAQNKIKTDKRFSSNDWLDSNPFASIAALYMINSKAMMEITDSLLIKTKEKQKIQFVVEQWLESISPSNFLATNPEAQKKLIESGGNSFLNGITNLMGDLQKGRISQTDESAFTVGENLAITKGAVVFENKIAQLIQYEPSTKKVGSVPLLIVPPCINKFYIMDLKPESSLVKFAVDQGNTVFLISWKNAGKSEMKLKWDDYVEKGLIEPIDIILNITKKQKLNTLGFCIGGTLLSTAISVLRGRNKDCINSLTLMASLLDFNDPGILDIFIDEKNVAAREKSIGNAGLISGSELASTFSFLRSRDLVWNYVVNNYLKGDKPVAFDLLFWNSDFSNLPGPFYSWYLRNMYLENNLKTPGKLNVCGQQMNLSLLDIPVYAMGAMEDHIVPWQSAYDSSCLFSGKTKFVLGASGHIAGCINPASKNRRSYWTSNKEVSDSKEWFESAKEHNGSWWNDWKVWLKPYQGKTINSKKVLGSKSFKPIEPAPGRYVSEKSKVNLEL